MNLGQQRCPTPRRGQYVDKIGVRVRIEPAGGATLDRVSLALTAPDGQSVQLDSGAGRGGESVWQAAYPTTPPAEPLDALFGWQPSGDWVLTVESDNAQGEIRVADFTVVTHGFVNR